MIANAVGFGLALAMGLILGMVAGFSFRDHLERRICGWFPGCDDE